MNNILKSKFLFGIMCVITLYCIYEYARNVGLQTKADDAKRIGDQAYTIAPKTTENKKIYDDFVNTYNDATTQRNSAKNTALMVGVFCGIFVGYYTFTNFIKK